MRKKDFANDIQAVATNVATDIGAIMKLVREEQSRPGSPSEPSVEPSSSKPSVATEVASPAPDIEKAKTAKARTRLGQAKAVSPAAPVLREKVTLQLSPETNERLTEAALRQKLNKEAPDTRQDIVEVALREWYERHGYA